MKRSDDYNYNNDLNSFLLFSIVTITLASLSHAKRNSISTSIGCDNKIRLEALKMFRNLHCNLNLTAVLLEKIIICDQFGDNFTGITRKVESGRESKKVLLQAL